ncbi:hypothetical protein BD779DRAFT_1783748 [Infundibulicybe gibba]|nr:hypothetical protein BD779DRAFT_1783748 [Infundibulicybe gibba]
MSDDDNDDNDDHDDSTAAYPALFRAHLAAFSANLAGAPSTSSSSSSPSPSSSRSASPVQELEYQHAWTPTEQDAFHHALRTHSRLRPDLISASIRTKNVLEVCAHLAALDAASRALPAPESVRDAIPAAVEVSQTWIEWEERGARGMHTGDIAVDEPQDETERERHAALQSLTATHLTVLDRILSAVDAPPPASSQSPPPDTTPDPATDPNLSPRSRRRIQKRLYMRRRRARNRGESSPPPIDPHTKLAPGRKRKPRRALTGRPKAYKLRKVVGDGVVDSDLDPDADSGKEGQEEAKIEDEDKGKGRDNADEPGSDADVEYAHPRLGGITAPYRLHAHLSSLGIDAAWLERTDTDMGMFHLARLAALQRMYTALHAPAAPAPSSAASASSSPGPAINTAVSPATVRLLAQLLRAFTHAALARAIVLQENERRMKGRIRVWRAGEGEGEVGHEVIWRAVRGMQRGARWGEGLGAYFRGLAGEGEEGGEDGEGGKSGEDGEGGDEGDDMADEDEDEDESEDEDEEEDMEEEDEDIEMQDPTPDGSDYQNSYTSHEAAPPRASLPVFRPEDDLHMPLVVLPLAYRDTGGSGEDADGEEEGEEMKDDAEDADEDDAALDAEDARRARVHERALWAAVARGGGWDALA